MTPQRPPINYYGSKVRMAPWIAAMLPPHRCYVEPFFGSGVLFAKAPSTHEIVSDKDATVVNFFKVLRDRPRELARACVLTPYARDEYTAAVLDEPGIDELERARRFWARSVMSYNRCLNPRASWSSSAKRGSNDAVSAANISDRLLAVAERLRRVAIDNAPAVKVVAKYGVHSAVIYADPPYLARPGAAWTATAPRTTPASTLARTTTGSWPRPCGRPRPWCCCRATPAPSTTRSCTRTGGGWSAPSTGPRPTGPAGVTAGPPRSSGPTARCRPSSSSGGPGADLRPRTASRRRWDDHDRTTTPLPPELAPPAALGGRAARPSGPEALGVLATPAAPGLRRRLPGRAGAQERCAPDGLQRLRRAGSPVACDACGQAERWDYGRRGDPRAEAVTLASAWLHECGLSNRAPIVAVSGWPPPEMLCWKRDPDGDGAHLVRMERDRLDPAASSVDGTE